MRPDPVRCFAQPFIKVVYIHFVPAAKRKAKVLNMDAGLKIIFVFVNGRGIGTEVTPVPLRLYDA